MRERAAQACMHYASSLWDGSLAVANCEDAAEAQSRAEGAEKCADAILALPLEEP
jgi:hypothetical protein